jgi:hypothetical protein
VSTRLEAERTTAPPATGRRSGRPAWLVDVALVAGLTALAALARWPGLYTVPALTDEADELLYALRHLRAGQAPLTNVDPYIGPIWTYLLMLAVTVAGPSPVIGRTLIFAAGCATVGLTYGLGRVAGGRWVGLIAGALLVPHVAHVLIVSHIGWSNCLSPLLSTATLLAAAAALRHDRPALLPVAGLLGGLTLQTHASTAPLLLALGLAVLAAPAGRRWLRTRWPVAGLAAALLGSLPWLVAIVQQPLGALRAAQDLEYAFRPAGSPGAYAANLAALATSLGRALASVMEEPDSLLALLARPQVAPLLALLVVGLVAAWRSGRRELPLVLLISPLITAAAGADGRWLPASVPRYLGPLWPVCSVLVGLGAVALAGWVGRAAPRLAARAGRPALAWLRWPALAALAVAVAGPGIAGPWQALDAYRAWYAGQPRVGDINAYLFELAEQARREWRGETLWLDRELWNDGTEDGGNVWMLLTLILTTSDVPNRALPTEAGNNLAVARRLVGDGPALLVLPDSHAVRLREQGASLTPLARYQSGRRRNRGAWAVYRLEPVAAGALHRRDAAAVPRAQRDASAGSLRGLRQAPASTGWGQPDSEPLQA